MYQILIYRSNLNPLSTENLQPLALNWHEALLTRRSGWGSDNELSIELPVSREVPGLPDALINQRVVVLEVSTESLGGERGPESDLAGASGLAGPVGEFGSVEREALLLSDNGWLVDEEEDLGCVSPWNATRMGEE